MTRARPKRCCTLLAVVLSLAGGVATGETDAQYQQRVHGAIAAVPRPPTIPAAQWAEIVTLFYGKALANRTIAFRGQVLDAAGKGVPGAMVRGAVVAFRLAALAESVAGGTEHDVPEAEIEAWSTTTDAAGVFEVHSRAVEVHVTAIEKAGYVVAESVLDKTYSAGELPQDPAQNEPIKFVIGEAAKLQPVTRWEVRIDGKADGSIHYVDVLAGREVTATAQSALLSLSIVAPQSDQQSNARYDWTARVACAEPCLTEAVGAAGIDAPESGYRTTWVRAAAASDADWSAQLEQQLFFRGRGGEYYGRLHLKILVFPDGQMVVRIVGVVNPNASRTLMVPE